MSKFARIIDLHDNNQLLLVHSYDEPTDTHSLTMTTKILGYTAVVKSDYESKSEALETMTGFTEIDAYKFRRNLLNIMNSSDDDEF